ncbi:MAG TPA: S8 family serine peptidase, partial [Phycisphaerae bacterium]|nr:S8 family serine peptidase [Phycisphaerae bacterium]
AETSTVWAELHPALQQRLAETAGPVKAWVFFADKGVHSPAELQAALQTVAQTYNARAAQRRALRGLNAARDGALFDEHDLPVVPAYVEAVAKTGARLHITSRWLNAVSVWADGTQLAQIATLACVDRLEAVRRSQRPQPLNVQDIGPGPFPGGETRSINYGNSLAQLTQINLVALHDAGFTGSGVIIGILDTGFHRTHEAFTNPLHPLSVIAEYDFVNNDGNTDYQTGDPSGQYNHGTMILGCIGAYKPGSLVGGAFNASFVLCKTEDTTQEVPAEEDNYVAGLEFIESHGCDMSTASLGYIDWYTQAQLDGQTAVTTIACNILTANGVHHTNAAGNEYHDSNPATSSLIAPADAFQVITCGAVSSSGAIASFSSDGPTADGRVKPEVLARGVSTNTVSPYSDTSYTTADGTSLSTPLVACAVACLIQARPYWTVDQMRQHLFETADYYVQNGTFDPLYVRGYGIVNAFGAYDTCADAGVVMLDRNRYMCADTVTITVNDCGLNADPAAIETLSVSIVSNTEAAGETVLLTELASDAAEFQGSIAVSLTDAAGVLQVSAGDTLTVTYIDAD